MIYLCITPEREAKTSMLMRSLARGLQRHGCPHRIVNGEPPNDQNPFVVWGQEWLTLRIVPGAIARGRPFWTIDNGYWQPARGTQVGYYRFCYRSMSPAPLRDEGLRQPGIRMERWREGGRHVLLAMPGAAFGLALGLDVEGWCRSIEDEVRRRTDRPVVVRPRNSTRPLVHDLNGAWALVTHSSNVAVDAVIAGVPVFVEPTSAAAPVGRLDLEIEAPARGIRKPWLRSLASQHFTVQEMQSGEAWPWLRRIAEEVDGGAA